VPLSPDPMSHLVAFAGLITLQASLAFAVLGAAAGIASEQQIRHCALRTPVDICRTIHGVRK
jgi:hypothetical protein